MQLPKQNDVWVMFRSICHSFQSDKRSINQWDCNNSNAFYTKDLTIGGSKVETFMT